MLPVIQAKQVVKHSYNSARNAPLSHLGWLNTFHLRPRYLYYYGMLSQWSDLMTTNRVEPDFLFVRYLVNPVDLLHVREVNLRVEADAREGTSHQKKRVKQCEKEKRKERRKEAQWRTQLKQTGRLHFEAHFMSFTPPALANDGLPNYLCTAQLWSVRVRESFSRTHTQTHTHTEQAA